MNKQQKAYAIARARLEAIEDAVNNAEAEYIRNKGIVNEDGTTPERLWMIDDEAAFEAANAEFNATVNDDEINDAKAALKAAEEALIDYGLSLPGIPSAAKAALQRGRNVYSIRQKLIDMTFKLDTKTVRR